MALTPWERTNEANIYSEYDRLKKFEKEILADYEKTSNYVTKSNFKPNSAATNYNHKTFHSVPLKPNII